MPTDDIKALLGKVLGERNRRIVYPSSRVSTIAGLAVGESVIVPKWEAKGQLDHDTRVKARLRLGDPNAQWKSRTTTLGVRVTRVR
jgi:hypothetical protein